MKVVMITQDFLPLSGGISRHLMNIYRKYLASAEFEVIVPDCIGEESDYDDMPFKVHRTRFAPFSLGEERDQANDQILEILESSSPDVVLFGYLRSHPEVAMSYRRRKPGLRSGMLIHGKEAFLDSLVDSTHRQSKHKGYTRKEADFYRSALEGMDYIFPVSRFSGELLTSQGVNAEMIVLNPSIQVGENVNREEARTEVSVSSDAYVLLSVGRLIKRKGHKDVVEAVGELREAIPGLEYVIVGDGPERRNIEELVTKRGLDDCVRVLPDITDAALHFYYSACDVFVLPCRYIPPNDVEGFGIVFLEAGAHRRACIAGNSGGVPEAVIDGRTGLLVSPGNISELADKMVQLYDDADLRFFLGTNAYARVMRQYALKEDDLLKNLFSR
mgnify:CR=1 FL=1